MLSSFTKLLKVKTPAILILAGVLILMLSGCGTSDSERLKNARVDFIKDDYPAAEKELYSPEVFKHAENRFVHYSALGSIAMSSGEYEKAIYFFMKARDLVNGLRSSHSGFSWFSTDYLSNGIEYSYLHYFLVICNDLLAEEGKTPAWSTPEIKDEKGIVLVPAQNFPARSYTPRDISDFHQKAHAELLAWDTHLQNLKNSDSHNLYRDDLWARLLASYIHAQSDDNSEKRTSELLAEDALKILQTDFKSYPSDAANDPGITALVEKLKKRDPSHSLFVLEAGVMDQYKIKRFVIGLSTLFKNIKDPRTRSLVEQIGIRVILLTAPEFGLVLVSGAVAGTISGSSPDEDTEYDGPPQQFSDAIDRSFGFEIQFPTLRSPPPDTKVTLDLNGQQFPLPVVSPLQEIISSDLKNRENTDMFQEAMTVGLQYLGALVPAIIAYKSVSNRDNWGFVKKLAIVSGFYVAKKVIDGAHRPDLRSWGYLPKLIAADVLTVPPGNYHARVTIRNAFGNFEKDLGEVQLGDSFHALVRKRIGEVSILKGLPTRPIR